MTAMGPASLAPGFGVGGGIGVSAAGAEATNGILTKASAYIDTSDIASAGNVLVTAADTDSISATVATASLAVGAAGGVGVGASIGASLAQNLIGWTRDGTSAPAEIQAYVRGSSIQADALTLSATAHETINATVLAGSVAIGGGGGVGIGASGSGVETTTRIASHVKAFIDGDGANGIHAGQISVTELDSSSISADAGAISVPASCGGGAGVSTSVGVALAYNEIANQVEAYVLDADQVEATAGAVTLSAHDTGSITARTGAASLSAAGGGGGGIAGGGAGAGAAKGVLPPAHPLIPGSPVAGPAAPRAAGASR